MVYYIFSRILYIFALFTIRNYPETLSKTLGEKLEYYVKLGKKCFAISVILVY